jgi:hypothetical protein
MVPNLWYAYPWEDSRPVGVSEDNIDGGKHKKKRVKTKHVEIITNSVA